MLVRRGALLAIAGIAIGVAGTVAVVASLGAARRVARVDPILSLRSESSTRAVPAFAPLTC